MSDERLNSNPEGESVQSKNEQAAPEVFEEFLEEQVQGESAAEEAAQEPEVKENENFSQSAPTQDNPTYAWSAASREAAPQPQGSGNGGENRPPMWESAAGEPGGARINMQVKKKKKRRWIAVLITCAVAFYVLLTALIVVGGIRWFTSKVHGGGYQDAPFFSREEPKVEEHLQIAPTPNDVEEAPAADGKLTVKQIAKKVRTSVVGVVAEGSMNFSSSSVGSGIIMSDDGYIITNNHVIENMNKISVVTDDGTSYNAYVIGTDSRTDLAVLKVDAQGLPAAEFGNSDLLEQGDLAVAIGNPAGIQLQNTVTTGVISAINRNIVVEDEEMTLIQTDASINPGNSGGPLVNEYGQVIGINTVKIGISYYEGLGFAIPINTAKPIIDELISRGYITGRPSIGISGATLSERDAAFYGLKAGMYVEFVHPYSDAYKKGLQAGDVIVAMNGTALTSQEEIKKIRDEHKAGDTVSITVFRQGREFTMDVVLMDEAELNKMGQPTDSRR